MKEKILATCLAFFVVVCSDANAEESLSPPGYVCWPLHFAGITVGYTNDAQAQRLLGHGIYRDEGDAASRYFIDAKNRATLHLVSYTYMVVGELTFMEGIDPEISTSEQSKAVSKWNNLDEGFGNWHQLNLGSTKKQVLENLGTLKEKISEDEWVYFTTCTCEIQNFFTIYFRNDHIFKFKLEAPSG